MLTDYEERRTRNRASQFKGVYKSGKKWKAQIQIDGKQYYLGVFDSEGEASQQYTRFAAKHGRSALLQGNNPSSPMVLVTTLREESHAKWMLGRAITELSSLNLEYVAAVSDGRDPSRIQALGELLSQLVSHSLVLTRALGDDSAGLSSPPLLPPTVLSAPAYRSEPHDASFH